MKMTLSKRYLDTNLKVLDQLGFSRAESLLALNMTEDDFDTPHSRIEIDRFVSLLTLAAETLGNPHIALYLGYKFRISAFAQTGSIYAYCENLMQVIRLNNRYQKLAIDAGEIEHSLDDDGNHNLCFRPYYSNQERYHPITDMIMGAYSTAFHWLSWSSGEDILEARLPYARPMDMALHERVFQSKIIFEAEAYGFIFSELAMTQTLTTHDPERLVLAKAKLESLLGTHNATETLDAAVEAAIRGAIQNGRVTSQVVADRMGQSWPSLRKALKQSKRGFRDRVDEVRKAIFIEKYEAGLNFAQIAQDLAYNDQPALNRAFHRWYGLSPTQWEGQKKIV